MPDSPALAHARKHAETRAAAGHLDDARALLERAIEIGRAQLAPGDTELLSTMRQLAGIHLHADDPMAARRVLEEAIEVGHRLAESDPLAVLLAYDLAVVAEELANRHVARVQYARVAAFGPVALGEEHPAVARARAYLAPGQPAVAPAPFASRPSVPSGSPRPSPASPSAAVLPVSASPSRKSWILAGAALGVVVLAGAAILLRPDDTPEPAAASAVIPAAPASITLHDAGDSVMVLWKPPNTGVSHYTITGAPAGSAHQPLGETGGDTSAYQAPGLDPARDYCFAVVATYGDGGSATSPQACTSRSAVPRPSGTTPSGTAGAVPGPSGPKPPAPAPASAVTAQVKTRIVSPADGSTVAWPFDARFTVSKADATATGTVIALSICVAGHCYLDGRLDLYDGVAAPYTVYLGSTKPEGSGVSWKLRLDRLPTSTFATLIAERDAAIAAGTWGNTSTRMSALNPSPVSSLTVTKGR